MNKEEWNILLNDLSGRLLYNVKCSISEYWDDDSNSVVEELTPHGYAAMVDTYNCSATRSFFAKPYLRSLSSMTKEEHDYLNKLCFNFFDNNGNKEACVPFKNCTKVFNFFYSRHLDFNGLINKGLAIEATNEMYSFKEENKKETGTYFTIKNMSSGKSFKATNLRLEANYSPPCLHTSIGSMIVKDANEAADVFNYMNCKTHQDMVSNNSKIEVYMMSRNHSEQHVADLFNVWITSLDFESNYCEFNFEHEMFYKGTQFGDECIKQWDAVEELIRQSKRH